MGRLLSLITWVLLAPISSRRLASQEHEGDHASQTVSITLIQQTHSVAAKVLSPGLTSQELTGIAAWADSFRIPDDRNYCQAFPDILEDLYNVRQGEIRIQVGLLVVFLALATVVLLTTGKTPPHQPERHPPAAIASPAMAVRSTDLLPTRVELLQDLLEDGSGTFLLSTDGRQPLTYEVARDFIKSGQSDISCFGITCRDRIALLLGSGPEAALAILALTSQASVMPLDPRLSDEELAFSLKDLPAKGIVALREHTARIEGHGKSSALTNIVIRLVPDESIAGLYSLQGIQNPMPSFRMKPENVALLLHTSGTTSKPKLVPLTHGNLILGALSTRQTLQLTREDCCLNMLPLYHIGGISCSILGTAAASASVVCAPRFGAPEGVQWLQSFQPSWYYAIPTIHELLMRQLSAPLQGSLTFVRNASAALLPSVAMRMQETFRCKVLPTYGMTECVPICSHHRNSAVQLSSVGPPAGPEVCISKDGEILVRGPSVITGYEQTSRDEDPNARAFSDGGWFHTGDLGTKGPDDYFYINGRAKEIVNRGGEKISPFAVEEATHDPRVIDVVAFPAPHELLGEEVALAVTTKASVANSDLHELLEALQRSMTGSLSEKWLPKVLVKVDAIPQTQRGKIARVGLAARLGLPAGTSRSGLRIYTFEDGHLTAIDCNAASSLSRAIDSLGLGMQQGHSLSHAEQNLALAMYSFAVILIVVHHQTTGYGGNVTLQFMPSWALAVLVVITRAVGLRWRLVIITISCAQLNASQPMHRKRIIILLAMYFALYWPISPMAEWLSEFVMGVPEGSCHSFINTRYFLPVVILAQLLVEASRKLRYPGLQCLLIILVGLAIDQIDRFTFIQILPPLLRPWIEVPWAGLGPCTWHVALYVAVGRYGRVVSAHVRRHWLVKSTTARGVSAAISGCILMVLLVLHVVNIQPFLRHYNHLCQNNIDMDWDLTHVPNQKFLYDTLREATSPRTNLEKGMDALYNLALYPLIALPVSFATPVLSKLGSYAWGIFCAQGLFFYCKTWPAGFISFGVSVRGIQILPSLQQTLMTLADLGCLQLMVILMYALATILSVCIPFQLAYSASIQAFDRMLATRPWIHRIHRGKHP